MWLIPMEMLTSKKQKEFYSNSDVSKTQSMRTLLPGRLTLQQDLGKITQHAYFGEFELVIIVSSKLEGSQKLLLIITYGFHLNNRLDLILSFVYRRFGE